MLSKKKHKVTLVNKVVWIQIENVFTTIYKIKNNIIKKNHSKL